MTATRTMAGLAWLALAGCGGLPAVEVHPHSGTDTLRQTFDKAFVSRESQFGEDQVVLVGAPIDQPAQPGPVIQPLAAPPLHTVMAIRLHWRAKTLSLPTDAGLNAVVHWYVYGSPVDGGAASLLHYVGNAFVHVDAAGDGADVTVSNGTLQLKDRFGSLRDPLGTFTIDASFHAVTSERQLHETLADVQAAQTRAAATTQAATRP